MPKKMRVEVDGSAIQGVIDVDYDIHSGWDTKTGKVGGEFSFSPLTITREMQPDSFDFLRRAKHNDEKFNITVVFRWQDPDSEQEEDYIWIELEKACVVGYTVKHQNWKNSDLGKYNPLEIIKLGYKKVTMKTANGSFDVQFEKEV